MKKWKAAVTFSAMVFAGQTLAVPISGTSLQGVLDDMTVGPVAGDSSTDVNTDQLVNDEAWAVTATGGSFATMIIELASFAPVNTFGVYDLSDPSNQVILFSGADSAGDQATLGIKADGSVIVNLVDTGIDFAANLFGYFIGSPHGTFHSETSLNADGVDHMVAFAGNGDLVQLPTFAPGIFGPGEFILAFEDQAGGGDRDYDDLVLMVESVTPVARDVPEPATLGLFGLGITALAFSRRKQAV